jgi:hypothetical protein
VRANPAERRAHALSHDLVVCHFWAARRTPSRKHAMGPVGKATLDPPGVSTADTCDV